MAKRPKVKAAPANDIARRTRALVTPEGVTLHLRLATAGARAGAFTIDALIMLAVLIALTAGAITLWGSTGSGGPAAIIWLLGFFLLRNFYFTLFESGTRAATPGKRALKLRVVARDTIVVSGKTIEGKNWVGCCGSYIGTFVGPFLEIPPTGHLVHMRFHEFYCFQDDKIIEVQAIWDIPELMMQAGAWPMSPSLGREMFIPGPASQDGLTSANRASSHGTESLDVVIEMLTNLSRHPSEGGPEIMKAEEYWHPCVNWYGPAGIGSMRGLDGFRNWHQIPFLKALPDRKGGTTGTLSCHFFGDGPYVIATGWPNMQMTVSGDGWLGIAPSGQQITMRSLDFWRVENNLIRENWVLVDLLDVYSQIGVDVFSRLREFNKARVSGKVSYPIGLSI